MTSLRSSALKITPPPSRGRLGGGPFIVVVLMFFAAAPCLAADQPPPPSGLKVDSFKKVLHLDDAQTEKMQMILWDFEKETTKKAANIQVAQIEMADLLNQNGFDYDKLAAKFKELSGLRADFRAYRIVKLMEARQFMKDDQYAGYRKLLLQLFFQEISGQ